MATHRLGPRLVVAGTSSGVGKTSIATGLMAALCRQGLRVGAAKVGPDYIDPGFHALATGRPGRNLDAWMCGAEAMAPLAGRAAVGCDVLVIEGVMGLFDGAADGATASTADIARLLDAPVVLVVDASKMSGSVAALVHGFAALDPRTQLAGVILNRVASDGHETMLRDALAPVGVPVVGALRRDARLAWPARHLGLVPVAERPAEIARTIESLADAVSGACDLGLLMAIARTAPERVVAPPASAPAALPAGRRIPVALAAGPAFSFLYPDNLEHLVEAGAELVAFDPTSDSALPEGVAGLYAGGGFPEVFAEHLADNAALLDDVRRRVADGLVTWAECGGLLWLCQALDEHRMAGVVPAKATMSDRLTLGYRRAVVRVANPLAAVGTELRGHEFHYSTVSPAGEALELAGRFGSGAGGFASPTLLATYLHLHLASNPALATSFVATAAGAAAQSVTSEWAAGANSGALPSGRDRVEDTS
ncbi:MAG TPA: cobyrinate a,c-diamide synthase [Acidimicrobiales bacterium]|nr:cobyrinate a,c-diamide synthase [Acidimicrobiales bacterium]